MQSVKSNQDYDIAARPCLLHKRDMIIREETKSDIQAIHDIAKAAFENHPISRHTEQFVINALRTNNVLTISLVAEIDGRVVGHAAFSPVTISDGSRDWYGLGPVSVVPEYQNRGIGTKLIKEGLSRLKALGAKGCALAGDPKYYERFGFRSLPQLTHEGVPQENFLVLPFGENKAHGIVKFHDSFTATK